jgi:protein-S-isoprenylcysteine O-methyltransferase Ste14
MARPVNLARLRRLSTSATGGAPSRIRQPPVGRTAEVGPIVLADTRPNRAAATSGNRVRRGGWQRKSKEGSMATDPAATPPGRARGFWIVQGLRFLIYLLLMPAALFLSAGRLNWRAAWVVFGVMLAATMVSRAMVARRHPALLEERASAGERPGVQPWDPWLVRIIGLLGPAAIAVVAGLDLRYAWSAALPTVVPALGLALLIGGYAFSIWAMVSNPFFSAYVRIQTDRGHTVVSDGPYRWLRHPSYAGGVASNLGLALALGSLWAVLPALLTNAVMVLRTVLEDRVLREQLAGYREYAGRVRYRLIPGLW